MNTESHYNQLLLQAQKRDNLADEVKRNRFAAAQPDQKRGLTNELGRQLVRIGTRLQESNPRNFEPIPELSRITQ